jgi:hypothetical protein
MASRSSRAINLPATLAMLHNPGLGPRLGQGVQRSASFHVLGDYRGNWWCGSLAGIESLGDSDYGDRSMQPPRVPLSFLTHDEQTQAQKEGASLNRISEGVTWLGRRAIDYVKTHPDDPHAAESLYLTVRATRYGCSVPKEKGDEQKAVSKDALLCPHCGVNAVVGVGFGDSDYAWGVTAGS